MNNRECKASTIVDYYMGAYGPTIRIWSRDKAQIFALQNAFLCLASGTQDALNLADVLSVIPSGMKSLTLRLAPISSNEQKALSIRTCVNEDAAFEWSMRKSGWERAAALIDGLLRQDIPGHQYLTKEGVDDALIELSYNE
jgi:hypothetical protein